MTLAEQIKALKAEYPSGHTDPGFLVKAHYYDNDVHAAIDRAIALALTSQSERMKRLEAVTREMARIMFACKRNRNLQYDTDALRDALAALDQTKEG